MATLDAIGIVSRDIAESCRFYRTLGVDVAGAAEGEDHFEAMLPERPAAHVRHGGADPQARSRVARGPRAARRRRSRSSATTPPKSTRRTRRLTEAGFTGKTAPYDAFWGQRYADVVDPDGNVVAPLRAAVVSVIHVGTSGWSYPSWRGDFYPADADPKTFLSLLRRALRHGRAEHDRLPAAGRGAVRALGGADARRVHVRGEDAADAARPRRHVRRARPARSATGSARCGSSCRAPRDDGLLTFLQGSLPPELHVAYDFRHESWDGVGGLVRVNDFDAEPFRYIRLREPPYSDDDLRGLAQPPAAAGVRVLPARGRGDRAGVRRARLTVRMTDA